MIVNTKAFKLHAYRDKGISGIWFRLFGYGVSCSNAPLTFSQRNKLGLCLKLGGIKITVLKPTDIGAE